MKMAKMADIRDEHGNPIRLTDEQGNPVLLTDEHGNPMWLTGVATKVGTTLGSLMFGGGGSRDGGHGCASDAQASSGGGYGDVEQVLPPHEEDEDGGSTVHVRSTSSGSSLIKELRGKNPFLPLKLARFINFNVKLPILFSGFD
ncbi:embryogenic cell protein 40-like isoform X2 [Benincasa hispida]|uniref:embryogenic cell protein 40-like isoform X2 n=1 Tax=Benincasa hispida TaxID=102211 RepID=UPI0019020F43|nr:embryogenic cell protein 40-like isoform X2 [Benincasa hispida]